MNNWFFVYTAVPVETPHGTIQDTTILLVSDDDDEADRWINENQPLYTERLMKSDSLLNQII